MPIDNGATFMGLTFITMEKKVVAFGASNSKNSINKRLAVFTASHLVGVRSEILDLNDFELPLYSIDLQKEIGVPKAAFDFFQKIKDSDGIILSLAEYNGLHTSAFKNLWDWMSRIQNMQIWHQKPMFLLSTSLSGRTENNVMKVSKHLFPHFGAKIIAEFYLPSFNHFFRADEIIEESYKRKFEIALKKYQDHLNHN